MLLSRNRMRALVAATMLVAASTAAALAQTPAPAAADPADRFFDDTVVHEIKLACNTRDWESLKQHYLDDTYYICDFRWNDQVVRNIGIRSRGTGSRSGVKPGLRVDFDRYTTDQKFLGLKSVILRNNTQDPSGLRERLSMLIFRRMGVKAEREAHARLYVNNVYVGLYTIVESIDKVWLTKNYGENDGYLYEYKFDNAAPEPFVFKYIGSDPALYVPVPFKPETHESAPRPEEFERFIWTVDSVGDALWRRSMEQFLDVKGFITHLAIENFLAEEDGITGDYGPNNFYMYRFENKDVFSFIPWDKSNTFWETSYWIFRNIRNGEPDHRNQLVLRALTYDDLRDAYLNTLLESADSAEQEGWLEARVAEFYDLIKAAATSDTTKPFTNDQFEAAIGDLRTFARERGGVVRGMVADERNR